ncbi:hypothetical protein Poly51_46750 [Rubripirellula tenax]|uniref:Uncharacterized protein n=1 Tax=Rubripirellula tenax TaxID=2528015 RepID=A0A5C6EIA2_9BACT|nr:hypothetical protein Poly51_46750 [Rubripirellula tenax]
MRGPSRRKDEAGKGETYARNEKSGARGNGGSRRPNAGVCNGGVIVAKWGQRLATLQRRATPVTRVPVRDALGSRSERCGWTRSVHNLPPDSPLRSRFRRKRNGNLGLLVRTGQETWFASSKRLRSYKLFRGQLFSQSPTRPIGTRRFGFKASQGSKFFQIKASRIRRGREWIEPPSYA